MYCIYLSNNIIILTIWLIVLLIINFIVDLIDFKKFVRKYYDLDINIFRFSFYLLKHKIKIVK